MKKMIVFVGFLTWTSIAAFAGDIIKTPMLDYLPTDLDLAFEIKTTKFEKVVLDCQSFFKEMTFLNAAGKTVVYLDESFCYDLHDFFTESKRDQLPVCLEVDTENSELLLTRETDGCQ